MTFRREALFSEQARAEVIKTLALAESDGGWPLAMLDAIEPRLSRGLMGWTAKDYGAIRRAQEMGDLAACPLASELAQTVSLLPRWEGDATFFSKNATWIERLATGFLELRSFMGCCAPGYTFAYVSCPRATLQFANLKSARLIGGLTRENLEREVLLLPGTRFHVVDIDKLTNTVHLAEDVS